MHADVADISMVHPTLLACATPIRRLEDEAIDLSEMGSHVEVNVRLDYPSSKDDPPLPPQE